MTREMNERQDRAGQEAARPRLIDNALSDYVLDRKAHKLPGNQLFEACHKSLSLASGLSAAALRADSAAHPLARRIPGEPTLPATTIENLREAKFEMVKLAEKRIEKYGKSLIETAHKCPNTTLDSVYVFDSKAGNGRCLQAHELPTAWNETLRPYRSYYRPDHLRLAPKVNSISVLQEIANGPNYQGKICLSGLREDAEELAMIYRSPFLSQDKELMRRTVKLDLAINATEKAAEFGRAVNSAESAALHNPVLGARVFRSGIAQFGIAAALNATIDNTVFSNRSSDMGTLTADTLAPHIIVSEAPAWLKLSTMIFAHAAAKYFAPQKSGWQ